MAMLLNYAVDGWTRTMTCCVVTICLFFLLRMMRVYYISHVESIRARHMKRIEKRYSSYASVLHTKRGIKSPLMTPAVVPGSETKTPQGTDSKYQFKAITNDDDSDRARAELVQQTGGIEYWPKKAIKDANGNYVIRHFDLRLSKDPYLRMDEEEETALEQLINRVRHLKIYYRHTDRLTLLRFLRARKGDVDKAEDMFRHMVAWWDSNNMDRRLKTLKPLDFYPGGVCGHDLDGDPVTWGRYGQIDTSSVLKSYKIKVIQLECARRYALVHHLHREDAKRKNEPIEGIERRHSGLTGILDVQGLGYKHTAKAGYSALKLVLKIPGLMFPETLKRAIIVRPPWIFPVIWSIVKLFIDPRTVRKIVVVSGKDKDATLAEIEKFVHRSQIPDWLGGDLLTRGTQGEDPSNWGPGWQDGEQRDGSFKGTLSVGGILPVSLQQHGINGYCNGKDDEMSFGDISHPKYHDVA